MSRATARKPTSGPSSAVGQGRHLELQGGAAILTNEVSIATLFGLTSKVFESIEKLVELNLQVVKAAMGEAAATARATLSVKDAQELMALQAGLLQPYAERAAAYSRHLRDIAAATNAEVSRVAEEISGHESSPRLRHAGMPQAALREALKKMMVAAQASANGAQLRKGHTSYDEIEQAAQTIEAAFTQIVDERLAERAAPEEVKFVVPENYVPGYEAAVEAGAQARTGIFKRTDMLNSQDIADRLGVSRETVNQRRHSRELLALQHEARGFRYPAWQIEPGVRDAMAGVLAELGENADSWAAYLFFTQANPLLSGKTPLQALKAGGTAGVLRAAAGMREELA